MAPIEGLREVDLLPADAAEGLLLSSEAGWNQILEDWRLMLALGRAVGMRDGDGRLVASALLLPYEGGFAWLSMVLVTERWRRRGLARRLTMTCLERAAADRLDVLLDATPLGEAIYAGLGFRVLFPFRRWVAQAPRPPAGEGPAVRPLPAEELSLVARYDAAAFGGGRAPLLAGLLVRSRGRAAVAEDGRGYVLARDGRVMTQIGPLVADGAEVALALLRHALAPDAGPVCLDVPTRHGAIERLLEAGGFAVQRSFNRMRLRSDMTIGDLGRQIVLAGPELG